MSNYLITQLYRKAEIYRHREFYRAKPTDESDWQPTSWTDFFTNVKIAGRAFYKLGAEIQDKVVICSFNCPEAFITEYGCYINRMITIPIYSYSSAAQFAYITQQSGAIFLFVGGQGQYELALKYCQENPGKVKTIVIIDNSTPAAVPDDVTVLSWQEFMAIGDDPSIKEFCLKRVRSGRPEDIASIIYTSGTTGKPKGVIMTHSMFEHQIEDHIKRLPNIQEGQLSLSFLPMSHVFEKAWLFFCVSKGLRIAFNKDPRHLESTLQEIQPNLMCCVPRFWEKIYTGIMTVFDKMNWMERLMVRRALRVGAKVNLKYRCQDRHVPPMLMREYKVWDRRFFRLVRRKVGITNGVAFPTAGAALSDKITHFMRSIGINLIYGYGMTESTATVSCFPDKHYEIGTVGIPMSGLKVNIDNTGEILIKGPAVTPGYYNDPRATAEAFTADGWFRTGDNGFFGKNGTLVLSNRKKDLIKTSTGKYIAPQASESLWASNRFIDEVAIVGEGKKYITALVVPNFGYLEKWAAENNITHDSREALCKDPKVIDFMLGEMQQAQADMSDYEKVKKITLLSEGFSAEKGEITNTMKIRRAIISNNYANHISQMYPEEFLDNDINATD